MSEGNKRDGESLVEEESVDEYVVEQRERSCWARAKHRFGRDKQNNKLSLQNRPSDFGPALGSLRLSQGVTARRNVRPPGARPAR
jgi:hypothetical protein